MPNYGKTAYARKLRKRMTNAEHILWHQLRNRRLDGVKFNRQLPIGQYVVDFCSREFGLIIEVDGEIHKTQRVYDSMRTQKLQSCGYRVLRFTNYEIKQNLDSVICTILDAI